MDLVCSPVMSEINGCIDCRLQARNLAYLIVTESVDSVVFYRKKERPSDLFYTAGSSLPLEGWSCLAQ